jgi:hypothetical protein
MLMFKEWRPAIRTLSSSYFAGFDTTTIFLAIVDSAGFSQEEL